MDVYQTEEQQVEAIKSFWAKYGTSLITGLVLGLSGFVGIGYYKDNKLAEEMLVSDSFQAVMEQSQAGGSTFTAAAEAFIKDNQDSSYAVLTSLALAKEASTHLDWNGAEKYLASAISQAKDQGVKGIATLRLARVQVQQEAYDKALTTLSSKLPESFTANVEEIKGDIYLKQGKADLARNSYQVAIAASEANVNPALQMKLDDLAVAVKL